MLGDVRHLLVFAKVVDKGSFRDAAEDLNLSVASVSLYISKLEKSLGFALLYRDTRKFSLTSDGEKIFTTAKEILSLYENEILDVSKHQQCRTTCIKVSIPAILINSPFMVRLTEYMKSFPHCTLTLLCSDNINDIVSEGIDVAFRVGDLEDSSLKARPVYAFQRVLVASPALLAQYPQVKTPCDLESIPWIGLTMRSNVRKFSHAKVRIETIRYEPRIQVDNVEAAYQFAKEGMGLATPPLFLAKADLENGSITSVLEDWEIDALKVYAVWPSNVNPCSAVYSLIHFMDMQSKAHLM